MRENIVILKLSEEELNKLQVSVKDGTATKLEKAIYSNCYGLNAQDRQDSVQSYL